MALGGPPGPGSRGGVFGQVDVSSRSCSVLISKSPPEGCAPLTPGQCMWSVAARGWWVVSASTAAMATVAQLRPQKLFPPSQPQNAVPTSERRGGGLGAMKRLGQVFARCSPSPAEILAAGPAFGSRTWEPQCAWFSGAELWSSRATSEFTQCQELVTDQQLNSQAGTAGVLGHLGP